MMSRDPHPPPAVPPEPDASAAAVLAHRPRLFGLAYRMLGEVADAEDVLQEGYLRWYQLTPAERATIQSPEGWLVTAVTRLALDRLRRAATARARYAGPWLPEPVVTAPTAPPDRNAELASDLSIALLALLERLAPDERAAFLLRDVFGADYTEIARLLERRPDAVRQVVRRARARVAEERTRLTVPPDARDRLLESFTTALANDDQDALLALLAPDVVLTSDGGGRAAAARQPIIGAMRVVRFLVGVQRKFGAGVTHHLATVNGGPALLSYADGSLTTVTMLAGDADHVHAIFVMRNPDKLRWVQGPPLAIA